MKFKLTGIGELSKALAKYERDTGRAFGRGIESVAREVWAEANQSVPVDTGALRASGDYWVEGRGWGTIGIVGYGNEVEGFERNPSIYCVFQHDAPFERRWLEIAAEDVEDHASDIFWNEISNV